jgi:hypothetical protein
MNFTPFTGPFTGSIPVHQFTAKFANASGQATTVAPGTVVAVSGGDGGLHYLRPHELVSQGTTLTNQTLITVPVNMGKYTARLADVQTTQSQQQQQQNQGTTTVQAHNVQQAATVQVLNHAGIKYNVTPVSMQHFSQMTAPVGATVLTVAYPADLDGSSDGKQQTQCFPVEIQGQDLCATLVVAAPQVTTETTDKGNQIKDVIIKREDGQDKEDRGTTSSEVDFQGQTITTTMPATWQSLATPGSTVADYLARLPASTLPLSLHHFLKFSAESIKKETSEACTVTLPPAPQSIVVTTAPEQECETVEAAPEEAAGTTKKKNKKKTKKVVKQPRMRPGQVQLTTALDGTTLFCCPECHMAYPDKDLLEQHLVAHKIERRFICDICGAGLKRKEHLDRHKQGHNPERPFICSVCMKGFKRKEHLNLHFVIHSGEKTHVCPECGKGFYRKDHLRKHSRSHLAKRVKSEMSQQIKIDIVQQVSSEASSEDPLKLIP